jgi:hypothetical protein
MLVFEKVIFFTVVWKRSSPTSHAMRISNHFLWLSSGAASRFWFMVCNMCWIILIKVYLILCDSSNSSARWWCLLMNLFGDFIFINLVLLVDKWRLVVCIWYLINLGVLFILWGFPLSSLLRVRVLLHCVSECMLYHVIILINLICNYKKDNVII